MGRSRLRTLRHAPRLHHDDRLDACGATRGRHELSCVPDGLDVKKDRAGLFVEREIIQKICDVDIELIADRNDP